VKTALKERGFVMLKKIRKNVTFDLNAVPLEASAVFSKIY
jgi:hypothetical protein